MTYNSPDSTQMRTDLDWLCQLAANLSNQSRSRVLQEVIRLFVAECILETSPQRTSEQQDELVHEEIKERLWRRRSDAYAHDLLSMAESNDPDLDEALFPDGRAEVVLVSDSEIRVHAQGLLEGYLDYIGTFEEYGLIHPSNYSGPMEEDEDKEQVRLIGDFEWMLRQWRDDFIHGLLKDCIQKNRIG